MIVLRKELTSRCSGLNFSVSLALMEAATLPSSPAMVNLGSRYSGSGAYGQQYLSHTECAAHLLAVFKWPSLPNLLSKPAVAIQQSSVI